MKLLSVIVFAILVQLSWEHEEHYQQHHYQKKYQVHQHKYVQHTKHQIVHQPKKVVTHYTKKPYYRKKNRKPVKWPKIKGRCSVIPNFKINGKNPVLEATKEGNVVILFLMKRSCKFCLSQLSYLNDEAEYNREIGNKVKVIAINHKRQPLSRSLYRSYPYINIYEEPRDVDIFTQLRAGYRQILIYDICGRQQYHYGWPYSWLGYPLIRFATRNTLGHHIELCGDCKTTEKPFTNVIKTTKPTSPLLSSQPTKPTSSPSRSQPTEPTDFAETRPPTEGGIRNIDGPFTN